MPVMAARFAVLVILMPSSTVSAEVAATVTTVLLAAVGSNVTPLTVSPPPVTENNAVTTEADALARVTRRGTVIVFVNT